MAKMRIPKGVLCLVTGMLAGFLLGICALSSLVSWRIDNYITIIRKLETEIEDRNTRLEKLQDALKKAYEEAREAKERKILVENIEVFLDYEGSELNKIDFENAVKEKYRHLVGCEVESLNADTIGEIIDKRIFHGDGKDFRLTVEKLYISRTIKVWVKAEER